MFVAGHTFPDFGPCTCGVNWPTIRNATTADLGHQGIAHSGSLTVYELDQIFKARMAEDERIAAAMAEVTG